MEAISCHLIRTSMALQNEPRAPLAISSFFRQDKGRPTKTTELQPDCPTASLQPCFSLLPESPFWLERQGFWPLKVEKNEKSKSMCMQVFRFEKSEKNGKSRKVKNRKKKNRRNRKVENFLTFCEKERSEVESICFSLLFTLFREIPMSVGPNVQGPFWFVA